MYSLHTPLLVERGAAPDRGADGLAIATDAWNEHGGGLEQYVAELARRLTEQRWLVDVLAARVHGPVARRPRLTVTPVARGARSDGLTAAIARYRRDHPARPVLATRAIPGATHTQLHAGLTRDALAGERASLDSRLRRACFWPSVALNPHRRRLLANDAAVLSPSCTAAVMATSHAMCRALAARGVAGWRVTLLPLGIDTDRFHPRGRIGAPGPTLRLLFVAFNLRLKGLAQALAAIAGARRRGLDVRLVVSTGRRAARARALVDRSGTADCVEIRPFTPAGDMAALYRDTHVLIHPAFFDPFPLAVVEALACGCPVITTTRCGPSELIEEGECGAVVPDPRDSAGLVRAIERLAEPGRWRRMSGAAARVGAAHRSDRHAQRLAAWLGLEAST